MVSTVLATITGSVETAIGCIVMTVAAIMMTMAAVVAKTVMTAVVCKTVTVCDGQRPDSRRGDARNFSLKYYKSHCFFVSCQFIGYLCTEI